MKLKSKPKLFSDKQKAQIKEALTAHANASSGPIKGKPLKIKVCT
tara:strand:+ start:803 stop:937 length:135 start_codon:yes stop_codon:yes gene_type:complete